MSDSVRPQRWQPTRLPRPWDSPDKNTGVGCYFLLQCMKVKSESEVAQSCLTLSDPMDCSLPCFSVHGIFQARVLEWGSFTLVFINKEINFCREQVTFSNSQVGRRGDVKTPDSKNFITPGSILCLIPLPGLKIPKPWKLGQRSRLMSFAPKDPLIHFLFHESLGKAHNGDSP